MVLAVALCMVSGWVHRLDLRLYDAASTVSSPPPLAEITIVGIDDASLAALGPLPWSRDIHAQLIDRLSAAGAKTIVYLPPFLQPESATGLAQVRKIKSALANSADGSPLASEMARLTAEAEAALDTDTRLASSIQKAGNVLLASSYAASGKPERLPSYVRRSALADPGERALPAHAAQHPIAPLGSVAAGVGHWVAESDEDGAVRQLPLVLRHDGAGIPSMALLAARHSLHLGTADVRIQATPSALLLGGLEIPTNTSSVMRPRVHATPDGAASAFATLSFVAVLNGKAPTTALKEKIVLVGAASESGPLPGAPSQAPAMHSLERMANAISNIRQGLTISVPGWSIAAQWVSVLAAVLFFGLLAPRLPLTMGIAGGTTLTLALLCAEWVMLRYTGQWVPLLLGASGALAGTAALAVQRAGSPSRIDVGASAEAAETHRMMGLALHGQGQLDMAFERLRKVPPSEAVMENLYHLAQDFERKRNFAQAKAVYGHILRHDREYKDTKSRYKRARAHVQQGADSRPGSSTPASLPQRSSAGPRLPGDASGGIPMLGRYQIEKELGKGAMGVVYQGRDPKIGRIVAIKTLALSQEFEGNALVDARSRFFREAETAGRLQHPNIVTIFDAGEEHDLAYIAMEFLKGADLAPACRKDHLLPVATVLSIAARVADALDYAHAHNVVHRDIKPANIMFDSHSDTVKVTDFGIARITDSSKTRTGLVLGTPSFMSPEQLAGKKVDGRSDLYALGVMLFQLLTGSLPLRGKSMTELMHKIATVEPPDIRQLRPELPASIAKVVAQALQKRPEARYQTGKQFAADLRGAAMDAPTVLDTPRAVVYDADRDVTGHEMADFQQTVMDTPAVRAIAPPPPPRAQ